ncbi:uncharacterized protein LOC143253097 isoform X2 [Tachypleus tridentatus]|uniref:uncharacterized protein LOC143253097 isoform X2 n=1 Tax=Tachypleus tridentatus TaxID=6853 RepID=UPI003FD442B5
MDTPHETVKILTNKLDVMGISEDYKDTILCPRCDVERCRYGRLGQTCTFARITHLFDNGAAVFLDDVMSFRGSSKARIFSSVINSKEKESKLYYRGCSKCGEDGHMSRDCPNVGGHRRSKSGCFKCCKTVLTQVGIGKVNLVASSMVKMDTSHETVKILTDKLEVMILTDQVMLILKRKTFPI